MFWRLSKQFATDLNRRFELHKVELHKVMRFHFPRTAEIHLVFRAVEEIITVQTRRATYNVE